MPLSRCAAIPLERRGISFYLEIATQKNWRSGTRDLDPERLCGVQAMVHFLRIRFRDVYVRAVGASMACQIEAPTPGGVHSSPKGVEVGLGEVGKVFLK